MDERQVDKPSGPMSEDPGLAMRGILAAASAARAGDSAAAAAVLLQGFCTHAGCGQGAIIECLPREQDDPADGTIRVRTRAMHPQVDTAGGAEAASPPGWLHTVLGILNEGSPQWADLQEIRLLSAQPTDAMYGEEAVAIAMLVPLLAVDAPRRMAVLCLPEMPLSQARGFLDKGAWLAAMFACEDLESATQQQLRGAAQFSLGVDVLTAFHGHDRFRTAAMELCNQMHTRLQADRVSLGLMQGRGVKLYAVSNTERVRRKMRLSQDLEGAMEEAADQQSEVFYPCDSGDLFVNREAEKLSQQHGPAWVISFPLWHCGEVVGVLTIERASHRAMDRQEIEGVRLACNLLAPGVLRLHATDRWLGAKLAAQTKRTLAAAVGPEHTWAKAGAIGGAVLLGVVLFGKGPDRVSSTFMIDTARRQVITAPYEGYLGKVNVRVGDAVVAGKTVLAELETAELRLRAGQLRADRVNAMKQASQARRDRDIAAQQIAEAEVDRIEAELRLLDYQVGQAQLVSRVGGVVLEGDLQKQVGTAVQRGQTLFEVASIDTLRAELYVSEDRVSDLAVGDAGELASASHPSERIAFTVEHIEPLAAVIEGRNVFKIRAALVEPPTWLRPGMEGVAKIEVGRRSLLWLGVRDAVNWVRMKLWI